MNPDGLKASGEGAVVQGPAGAVRQIKSPRQDINGTMASTACAVKVVRRSKSSCWIGRTCLSRAGKRPSSIAPAIGSAARAFGKVATRCRDASSAGL